jgi:signal transduction histidine kinase/ActR/RegA family two-component response regulator
VKKDRRKKHKELNINAIMLTFNDADAEKKYNEEYYEKSIVAFRFSFIVVTALYGLFGILDVYVSKLFVSEFAIVRYCIITPLLLSVWIMSFFPVFKKIWQPLVSVCFVIGGWGIAYMLLRFPENLYYYGGLFLIFIAGYFFIKLHFRNAVYSSILVLLGFNLAPILSDSLNYLSVEFFISSNAFYLAAIIISAVALYNNKLTERKEFIQRLLLKEQQEKIKTHNDTLEENIKERTQLLEDKNRILNKEIENRKRIEEVLIIAKQKAEESDRLKSAFLTNMSHEIRTPMNGIIGFLDLFSDPDLNPDERQEYLDIIKQSGNRLLETINDILEISKIEAGEVLMVKSDISLNKTFQYINDFFAREANAKGIELKIPQLKKEWRVNTDGNKLEYILSNLIKNAIKFTNSGSIEIGFEEQADEIQFFVSDTGIGIPEDKFKVIFDRFVQADLSISRGHEGAGLGLSICKAYVEYLGGKIWLESEVQQGSTFYFTIPHTSSTGAENEENNIVTERAQPLGYKKNTVLVAEDDNVSYSLIETTLKKKGIGLIRAINGIETIEFFKQNRENISAILMDLKMPELDGIEATKQIREIDKEIPIIAQTAFALAGDKELALAAGCTDYITKPLKHHELLAILHQAVPN